MTATSSPLRGALEDYLALRRALGFRLAAPVRLLGQFVSYLEARGTSTITISDALEWAVLPAGASPAWQAIRLSAVRGFAACLHGTDPSVQVPPAGLIRRGNDRATPYLYSDASPGTRRPMTHPLRSYGNADWLDQSAPGISTDPARGPETTGTNRHVPGKPDTRTGRPTH